MEKGLLDGTIANPALNSITFLSRSFDNLPPVTAVNNVRIIKKKFDVLALSPRDVCEIDVIIHGASSNSPEHFSSPTEIFNEVTQITQRVANLCSLVNIPLVYLSSGAVYDKKRIGMRRFKESDPLIDINVSDANPYAKGKILGEQDILSRAQKQNTSAAVLRIFAIAGPLLPRDKHFAFGNFVHNAQNRRHIEVKAANAVWRSYIYETDLCNIILAATYACCAQREAFIINVGGAECVELRTLASFIAKKFGVEVKCKPIDKTLEPDWYVPAVDTCSRLFKIPEMSDLDRQIKEVYRLTVKDQPHS